MISEKTHWSQEGRVALCGALLAVLLWPQAVAAEPEWVERSLELANEARAAEGLEPLEIAERLVAAAEAHAEDMLARDYYGHVSPEGETVRDRYLAEGGSEGRLVSENLALCEGCPTPPGSERVEAFHDGWMESPEHREAILDPGLSSFGFAMRADGVRVHGVQTFAGPGRPRGLAPGEPVEEMPPDALRAHALEAINVEREAEGLPPLEPSDDLDRVAEDLARDGRVEEPDEGLLDRLPEGAARDFAGFATVTGGCGGCGRVQTATDVEDFFEDWLAEPQLAETLLDAEATHLGYALSADGEGRKAAAAVLGIGRR
jgi:uncharacterized protein YkwD